jgi:hypothetical protein
LAAGSTSAAILLLEAALASRAEWQLAGLDGVHFDCPHSDLRREPIGKLTHLRLIGDITALWWNGVTWTGAGR